MPIASPGKFADRFAAPSQAEGELPTSDPRVDFRELLEASLDVVWQVTLIDGHFEIVYTSPSSFDVFGWTHEELIQHTPAIIFPRESMAIIANDIKKLTSGAMMSAVVIEAIRRDGSSVWLENRVRVLPNRGSSGLSVIVAMRDVTERKLLLDQLAQQALIDGLTQISNRRAFDEAIQREWKRSLRTAQPLSLVLIDLDFFKLMNDRYGHQSGDDCLREVAKAVRRTAQRPEDVVARYGGEELAVLLPATDLEGAEHLARSACDAVESLRIPLAGNPVAGGVVTVSCGVSTALARLEPPRCMPEALLLAADGALYQSKAQGRNRVTALPVDPEQCSEDAGAAASPAH